MIDVDYDEIAHSIAEEAVAADTAASPASVIVVATSLVDAVRPVHGVQIRGSS